MIKADHIMLRTNDLEKSIKFYENVLNMFVAALDNRMENETNKYNSAFMECKDSSFQVELVYNDGKDSVRDYVRGNVFDHLAFRTDEIESIYEKAKSFGSKMNDIIIHDVGEKIYKIGGIFSPEGIVIGLVQKDAK